MPNPKERTNQPDDGLELQAFLYVTEELGG
jgi:hypothetical protein